MAGNGATRNAPFGSAFFNPNLGKTAVTPKPRKVLVDPNTANIAKVDSLQKQVNAAVKAEAVIEQRVASDKENSLTVLTDDLSAVIAYPSKIAALHSSLSAAKKVLADSGASGSVAASVHRLQIRSGPKPPPAPPQKPSNKNLAYLYNAPLVREAYFTSRFAQGAKSATNNDLGSTQETRGIIVDEGAYNDAQNAWTGVVGGRGTIQMDRTTFGTTSTVVADKGTKVDPNHYGFKFLYNPNSVNMSWGVTSIVNPAFIAQSLSEASPLALGLIQSNISFSVLLNRIEDFKYLNANGLIPGVASPYARSVSPADMQEIYTKGTMYDLDYLFKVLMGGTATFTSPLNGKTSDRGWLNSLAVELHLGAGLRYRVRVSDLQVAHTMFNSRMVPILSTVSFVCTRFYDAATAVTDTKDTLATYNSGSLAKKFTTP